MRHGAQQYFTISYFVMTALWSILTDGGVFSDHKFKRVTAKLNLLSRNTFIFNLLENTDCEYNIYIKHEFKAPKLQLRYDCWQHNVYNGHDFW